MAEHCKDIEADRKMGEYWERQFCELAGERGKAFTPMQIARKKGAAVAYHKTEDRKKWNTYTLPDITIWSTPGEHHEIKHKNPAQNGMFGLEIYRFDALLWFARETDQSVMYTIHNHDLAGGRDIRENNISHWVTACVRDLDGAWFQESWTFSWVNGMKKEVPIYYWEIDLWQGLALFWETREQIGPLGYQLKFEPIVNWTEHPKQITLEL